MADQSTNTLHSTNHFQYQHVENEAISAVERTWAGSRDCLQAVDIVSQASHFFLSFFKEEKTAGSRHYSGQCIRMSGEVCICPLVQIYHLSGG